MSGQSPVERAKKRSPLAFEMLPSVLAIENDRDDGFPAACSHGVSPAGFHEAAHEILRGFRGTPVRVGKADQI